MFRPETLSQLTDVPPPTSISAKKKRAALVNKFRRVVPRDSFGKVRRKDTLLLLNARYLRENPITYDTLNHVLYGDPGKNLTIETAFALKSFIEDVEDDPRLMEGPRIAKPSLTPDQVHHIRNSDEHVSVLGRKHGVTDQTIRNIQSGKRWKHLA